MNRPHFRRHPRPVDPEPPRDWIDWLGNGLPTPTRYGDQWPAVLAAEGGLALGRALDLADLPADQSGFTGWGEYEIEPEPVVVTIKADVSRFREAMAQVQAATAAVKPRGRHRQTDPLDLILADLRAVEDRLS